MQSKEFAWFHDFSLQYKTDILQAWLSEAERRYPGRFELADLRRNGEDYYDLLTDMAVPVDSHPLIGTIGRMAEYHVKKETPITLLIESSHVWRRCVAERIQSHVAERGLSYREAYRMTTRLSYRIDRLQDLLSQAYCELTGPMPIGPHESLNDPHADRLNVLGKMAASMAHELRNPLTSISGFLKLIRSRLDSPMHIGNYLDIIETEFDSLYSHINNFLHFSKGNPELEEPQELCELDDIVESVVQLVRPRLIEENVDIRIALSMGDSLVRVQKKAIQQVLINLVSNSIDALHNVDYPKRIEVSAEEDEEGYHIRIRDNGDGIPKEVQDKLFQPFVTSKSHGTGIGLAICKQIIEKNEGAIEFASRPGETVFTVRLKKPVPSPPCACPLI